MKLDPPVREETLPLEERAAKVQSCPDKWNGWLCTRERGHSGDHIAHGGSFAHARWPGEPKKLEYSAFQDLCAGDLAEGGTMSTEHDECAAQLFAEDTYDFESSSILGELLNTGSVTVRIGEKEFVVSLKVEEV